MLYCMIMEYFILSCIQRLFKNMFPVFPFFKLQEWVSNGSNTLQSEYIWEYCVYLHNQYPSPSVTHWELLGVYLRDWWADLRVCLYLNLPQFYLIRLWFELSGSGGFGFLNLCPQVKMDVDFFILPPLIDYLQKVPLSVSIFSLNKRSKSIKV